MPMTLKDFIEQTLVGIVEGIEGAKRKLGEKGSWVSPPVRYVTQAHGSDLVNVYADEHDHAGDPLQEFVALVRFDVAVHAGSEARGGGGIEVAAVFIKGKTGGDVTYEDKSVSRIQFSIPLRTTKLPEAIINAAREVLPKE